MLGCSVLKYLTDIAFCSFFSSPFAFLPNLKQKKHVNTYILMGYARKLHLHEHILDFLTHLLLTKTTALQSAINRPLAPSNKIYSFRTILNY